ncbi:AAA family ATPase [Borreliella burgdorferi]|uniref:ATP-dependent Clp protease, subunit A n=1 Tax=Borreliella burgdorferi (strain ZS7) TaxID=445985 RepID=A0A0H3C3V5_BORBZ|nr:ATP-dependent Clp protease ATP-binding subunit [Borreliella burgdorferi]ACK74973.1 ATP-dependent Clp protease, subunit A [Borreliella burgdorferi ZS7]EEH31626.1 ATP-dependent Clp protease, subunit A [Borreliella burgdorferi Bol26]MCS2181597.1 ATP-dependent Clp protease ATP-binding subunit [Borreliella burgdorferi]WKC96239.1 ATP-dependent Clp protease ATP-binding subunit [Borreliella burgdorferi]WKC97153.1 ATP-dependent Clp protease ATP-binding subunit [Borreliella burgdorferi]
MYDRRALNCLFFNTFLFFMESRHLVFTEEHIFYGLIKSDKVKELLNLCAIDFYKLNKQLEEFFSKLPLRGNYIPDYVSSMDYLYDDIISVLFFYKKPYKIQEKDLLWVLVKKRKNSILDALLSSGFNLTIFDKLIEAHDYLAVNTKSASGDSELIAEYIHNNAPKRKGGFHIFDDKRDELDQNNIFLESKDSIGNFLTNVIDTLDLKYNPLIGRSQELSRLIQVILRKHKSNPILFGEPGVGKTVLIQGLAYKIKIENVPKDLIGYEIYSLDIGRLVSGTKYRGDLESRVNRVLDFLSSRKKVMLFIDEIHMIVGAGATSFGSMDISNLLKPILTLGKIKFIGATTEYEYRKFFLKDKALMRRFQSIELKEPNFEDAYNILQEIKKDYERYHNVEYTDEAIQACILMSQKYIKDRFLPDKAFDILDELGSKFKLENIKRIITKDDVCDLIKSIVGSNIFNFEEYDGELLINLENRIKKELIMHDNLVLDLILNIKLLKFNLLANRSTIGIFAFIGASGSGKCKLMDILSEEFKIPKFSLNMGEYNDFNSLDRLIGPVLSNEGYYESTRFFKFLNKSSNSIIFLSDFDKCNKRVLDFFLEGFKTGKLFDGLGKKVSLSESLIVISINAESKELNSIGFRNKMAGENDFNFILKKRLPNEFLELIDHVFVFKSIDELDFEKIIFNELNYFARILRDRKFDVFFEKSVVDYIREKIYGKGYSLKSVRKFIFKELGKLLIDEILFKKIENSGKIKIYLDETIKYEFL